MGNNRAVVGGTTTKIIRATREPPQMSLRGNTIVANRGLLRIDEAAQWLGVGRTKAYELVLTGYASERRHWPQSSRPSVSARGICGAADRGWRCCVVRHDC